MLENIAAQILNRYIGHYVENINTKNLSIGLLQGAVELENLPLRKDAFDDLDLPGIVLKSGHIGKVILRIKSYKSVRQPWVIEIQGLRLVVGPGQTTKTLDKERERLKKEEKKRNELEAMEAKWRAKHGQNTSMYSFLYERSSSIITTIMENLQFEIHDVHIRYEDDTTLPQSFACGIVIKNITSKSTDEKWVPDAGERSSTDMMYKLLQLDDFSIYWDPQSKIIGDLPFEELKNELQAWEQSSSDTPNTSDKQKHFLLSPVCGEAKLTKNSSPMPLRLKTSPRILLDVLLGEISLHLSHTQYKQAIALASEFSRSEKRNTYKDGRPEVSCMKNPKAWWRWAFETHVKQIKKKRQKCSLEYLLNRAKNNVEYVKSYEKVIKSKTELEKIASAEITALEMKLQEIEKEMIVHEIQILRELVFERTEKALTKKLTKTKEQTHKKLEKGNAVGWGSWLRGWATGWGSQEGKKGNESDPAPGSEEEMKDEDNLDEEAGSSGLKDSVFKDMNEEDLYEIFGEELSEQDTNDTFMKRDSVFMKLNFKLDAGTLTLHEDSMVHSAFIGIEFRDVTTASEWRPRYKSSHIKTDLGSLYVKDLSNKGSQFADLIKPQSALVNSCPVSPRETGNIMQRAYNFISRKNSDGSTVAGSPVFSMLFQNQPITSSNRFTNRLEIASAPIVITFLPNLVERVKNFFKSSESDDYLLELDDAASERYEAWKQKSQMEIRRTVKRMMDGKSTQTVSEDRWGVTLNISAPEIILPEDVSNPNTDIVIANLGHMTFKNHNEDDLLPKWENAAKGFPTNVDDDGALGEEDDFVTPPDTPTNENLVPATEQTQKETSDENDLVDEALSDSPSQLRLNEKLFYEKMYEQFQMRFTDLQVLVARIDEKWETTRSEGKGPHHLVERFSVDLLMERRVVPTLDPKCPAVKLKGNLPSLTIHLSHEKVGSFFRCLEKFSKTEEKKGEPILSSPQKRTGATALKTNTTDLLKDLKTETPQSQLNNLQHEKAMSKQLLCQFSMNEVSVLLEDGPTPLSVLEVKTIQAEFTKRPFDHSTRFSIHSILLIDTKQEIGHDYELLLASHRNVKMDLGSGNILDSGSTSPTIDGGQPTFKEKNVKEEPLTKNILSSVAKTLTQTNAFMFSAMNPTSSPKNHPVSDSESESGMVEEDLITVEWTVNQSQGVRRNLENPQLSSPGNVANIKFTSLDLVLNLKTWIALLDFLHRLKPQKEENKNPAAKKLSFDTNLTSQAQKSLHEIEFNPASDEKPSPDLGENSAETEVFVQFNELNILLMRHIEAADKVIGRKVATLSLHDTKVHALLGENIKTDEGDLSLSIDAQGSVGGLALQDLTNAVRDEHGGLQGLQVLCLGNFAKRSALRMKRKASSSDVGSNYGNKTNSNDEAFKFEMQKGKRTRLMKINKRTREDEEMQFQMDAEDSVKCYQEELVLNLHLASVLYMHTPRLIAEVLAISDEAGDIINAKMNPDTRQAVKDMAYSIMDKSIAALSTYQAADDVDGSTTNEKAFSKNLRALFKLTVDMQSPIVALPKCHGSFELLVANLGEITVKNGHALNRVNDREDAMDYLFIEIADMSICSKRQIEEEKRVRKSPRIRKSNKLKKTASGPSLQKLKESMSSKDAGYNGTQILHDTSIRLTVIKEPFDKQKTVKNELDQRFPKMNSDGTLMDDEVDDGPINDKKMSVDVKMTLPLMVTLSKTAYEQLLKTLDHISYGGNIDVDDIEELEDSLFNASLNESSNCKDATWKNSSGADSTVSYQSTPSHGDKLRMFEVPGLEFTPSVAQSQSDTSNVTTRKYTPISANIMVPQIEFKLTQDLSVGEQGVVKVTLEGFSAKFEKENRSTTALDLTLGSLSIEDLFQDEDSKHRHIVSSISPGSNLGPFGNTAEREYLSSSCPDFMSESMKEPGTMSSSLPSQNNPERNVEMMATQQRKVDFRPYFSSGAFGVSTATHDHQAHRSRNSSGENDAKKAEEGPLTPPCSPTLSTSVENEANETLVRIRAFLVDGKATAYDDIYNRTNRRIDIDFNSLDCKINPSTWVILLDFFGIGTAPKKTYTVDPETEKEYTTERRLAVSSYYENQPDDFINSEIDFKVRSFSLIFNKEEYEFVKANMSNFETHVQIRDGVLRVSGQLGSLSASDLSPNGSKYRERFVFAGKKAMDFDIQKYDEYDEELKREFDICVKLRMSAINYVHTHRFHQELVAYLLHFQQLQEVLGRMRAASVGQTVHSQTRRQARILLDIEADSPVLLIPESSHSDRLVVADLGNMTVKNSFKWSGDSGTLACDEDYQFSRKINPDMPPHESQSSDSQQCLLDVLHAVLDQMDLYTAVRSDRSSTQNSGHCDVQSVMSFPSFIVKKNLKPLLREKCKLSLQIERNLEKETSYRIVPDTSVSGQLSSVYCTVDLQQYWLIRGILDHNLGEPIPEFPQPTAFMQPPSIHTVLSGSVYTGMSIDMNLLNVSVELLRTHGHGIHRDESLARLDYVKSRLSYRSFSDQTKTINLSCETFVASDTRWKSGKIHTQHDKKKNEFLTVLGPTPQSKAGKHTGPSEDCLLQFELQFREGPGFLNFTALLVDMRVYIISDWLSDVHKYIIVNPNQPWCDSLREKASNLLEKYGQIVPGQEQQKDSETIRDEQFKLNVTNTDFVLVEDTSCVDSDAVILRMTSVLHVNPSLPKLKNLKLGDHRKLLSCTLQSLEVFSCQLDIENKTELSIVDPMKVNIEINPMTQEYLSQEERDFDLSLLDRNKLEVSISELNTRVSYNDLLLFLAITKSFSPTKRDDVNSEKVRDPISTELVLQPQEEDVLRLVELGYSREDSIKSLIEEDGDIERAGEWLIQNAKFSPVVKVRGELDKVEVDVPQLEIPVGHQTTSEQNVQMTERVPI